MEKWKAKYASHFPTPSTATRYLQKSMRYTNNPTGTKDRALQPFSPGFASFPPVTHEDVDVLGRQSSVLEQIMHYAAGCVDGKWEEFSADTLDPFPRDAFET